MSLNVLLRKQRKRRYEPVFTVETTRVVALAGRDGVRWVVAGLMATASIDLSRNNQGGEIWEQDKTQTISRKADVT